MPTGKAEYSAEVPVKGAQSPIKTSFSLETTHENLLIILDKPFQEGFVERTAETLRVQHAGFPYEKASNLVRAIKEKGPAADTEDFEAQGLDDRIDDLLTQAEDALKKTKITATSGTGADGKRNLEVRVEYDGEEVVNFSADDLKDLTSDAISNALDEHNVGERAAAEGGEVVEQNRTPRDMSGDKSDKSAVRWRGIVTKYRATADGENDNVDNENDNTLVQTKAGFIVVSAADINLNAGVNATLAIFIA